MENISLSSPLAELVAAFCDREITDEEVLSLEQLLLADEGNLKAFVRFMDLHRCLVNRVMEDAELAPSSMASSVVHTAFEQVLSECVLPDLATQEPVVSRPAKVSVRFGRWSRWLHSPGAAACAVAICFYGGFAILAWNLRPDPSSKTAWEHGYEVTQSGKLPTPSAVVAKLIAEKDCVWHAAHQDKIPHVGTRLRADELLQLRSGVAEVVFTTGASVAIKGPCNLKILASNKGYLRSGKLAAHVPVQASGFEVETPTARIVDLGTDFRLDVNREETRLAVIAGKVDLLPVNVVDNSGKRMVGLPRRVVAGQAVAVTANAKGAAAVRATKFDAEWASAIAREAPRGVPSSWVVAYQISENVAGNQRDFRGGVGLDFEVRVPIRVFSLGVFDHLGDGINSVTSPTVQLWSRDTKGTPKDSSDDVGREVLAVQEFTVGNAGELKLGHRFKLLRKPIELPVGSYSIVAYGLFDTNPSIAFGSSDQVMDFSNDPGWTGSNNSANGNSYSWSSGTSQAGGATGKVGGTFARTLVDSYFGDLNLSQTYGLGNAITATGKFDILNISSGWYSTGSSRFFIGHFSESSTNREFLGLEFQNGATSTSMLVRGRIQRPNVGGGDNTGWITISTNGNHTFSYTYDPTLGDIGDPSPHGRLTLTIDTTTVSVNLGGSTRNSGAQFNAFGMGYTNNLMSDNTPSRTAQIFIDDVGYSGCRVIKDALTGSDKTAALPARGWVETHRGAIVPIGSRLGECKPGTFPEKGNYEPVGFVAGSFEYCLEAEGGRQRAVGRGR
jgi:hypothetical protein